ncbi:uncharacterized protein TRUGW13939_11090 [Talaromyces rugulosus]|uniref:DJ-1/PfpI domain-containing protein n=1 Tax=Talaromyces rugulosus TaxID=121627 RepID=A0A7H8RD46_TALRU|nr:uncharacterized protein TRUGW13939_11090 [Talaromyces rugulosus]QKX63918.1 hypothetical protein TRUGW13939_11090 [Talaromyces rugulosus]
MAAAQEVKIGMLLTDQVQLLDMAAVDLLQMASPEYMRIVGVPEPVASQGKPVKIIYIGKQGATKVQEVTATSGVCLTHTTADSEVAPGSLDILLIPGPDPNNLPDQETLDFVRAHNEHKTTMLVICTGALLGAHSGIYNGRNVTGPRMLEPLLKQQFPDVHWDFSIRSLQDGHLWTAGGITNGLDLVASYIRATYPKEVAEFVCSMAEVGDRPLKYEA